MKNAVAIVLCAAGLSGCFTSNVLVTIRPDGSGTVEQTTTIHPAAIVEFQRLASPEPGANHPDPVGAFRDLRRGLEDSARALRAGTNLRLRSSRAIDTASSTGWVMTYDFDDISALNLDLLPQVPGAHGFVPAAKDTDAATIVRTTLDPLPDGLERLTFRFPNFAVDPSAEPPASWATGSSAEMSSFRKLMEGSRITLAVDSEAPIVRTNSPFRRENRVTLLDADLPKALFSKEIGMLAATPSTFHELLTLLGDLPGVMLARDHEITIDLQNPSTAVAAQPAQPSTPSASDTEIFLASLLSTGGKLIIGPPINISNNPGYDNQPSFTASGNEILFASSRGDAAPPRDGRGASQATPATGIFRYDISSRTKWRVTNTPEGEFSPLMMSDGKNISIVRVEADGTQRLWQVANSDNARGASSVILAEIKPVGYYAWMDDRTVALFVLGQNGQPSTLQVADLQTGKAQTCASDIGRSIQRMPSGDVSFVQRAHSSAGATTLTIKRLARSASSGSFQIDTLVAAPSGAADPFLTWMPDGSALAAVNSTLYQWRAGDSAWTAVANLGAFGLRDVTRLAVSPKGNRIAIVAAAK